MERAGAFEAEAVGARQIADALPVVRDRDDVDDVLDPVIMEVEPGLAPCAEVVRDFGLDLPALRRDEVGVAGIFAVAAELGLGEEIVEADLADAAAQLEADVPVLGRPPAERDAALGPEEFARRLVVVDPVELRDFGAGRDLQVEIGGQRPAERPDALVADFGDLAAALGKRRLRRNSPSGSSSNSRPFWSSELNARSSDTCQSFLPLFQ